MTFDSKSAASGSNSLDTPGVTWVNPIQGSGSQRIDHGEGSLLTKGNGAAEPRSQECPLALVRADTGALSLCVPLSASRGSRALLSEMTPSDMFASISGERTRQDPT